MSRVFFEEMRKLANFLKPMIHRKLEENKNWIDNLTS